MPTSSEEPLRPPLAASSPMKGSLWALLRLISRVYCGKAASESEQEPPTTVKSDIFAYKKKPVHNYVRQARYQGLTFWGYIIYFIMRAPFKFKAIR